MRADLALIGFGNVARRFVRLLDEQRHRLAADEGLEYRIVGIATRRHGAMHHTDGVDAALAVKQVEDGRRLDAIAPTTVSTAADVIAALATTDAPLRVVIETTTLGIENGRPAIDHVEAALASGCHVVTANKGPAAFAYAALSATARAAGLSFLFEGAVMDGVPVFNLVRETMPTSVVQRFRGIVNSTTNHILTALEHGEAFAPALARMQALGIAEADPSLDVDGWDAAAKAAALANVFMGARHYAAGRGARGTGSGHGRTGTRGQGPRAAAASHRERRARAATLGRLDRTAARRSAGRIARPGERANRDHRHARRHRHLPTRRRPPPHGVRVTERPGDGAAPGRSIA